MIRRRINAALTVAAFLLAGLPAGAYYGGSYKTSPNIVTGALAVSGALTVSGTGTHILAGKALVNTTTDPITAYASELIVSGDAALTSANPILWYFETGQAVDEGGWAAYVDGKQYRLATVNNANTVAVNAFTIDRGTGTAITSLNMIAAFNIEDAGSKPTCDSSKRGWLWMDDSGAGVKDTEEVCAKDAADAYAWRVIY